MIPFAQLKTQFESIEDEVRAAIDEVLKSCWYIMGNQMRGFEEEFAAYTGTSHCLGVASGTDAITLALKAVGVTVGDEVVTVANTCIPTLCGVSATGASPVLVDITPATLTMDPSRIESAITERTKAIVPVHLYGHPCDMDSIMEVAQQHGLAVVEDCAQAHGTEYRGRRCGSLGDAAAFSFYPSKNLGAYGDGGAVVTNNEAIAENVRMLRNYGEERRYYHTVKGGNSRLDELQAAILRVKLKHLDEWNKARRIRAEEYCNRLRTFPLRLPLEAKWAKHIYHLFVIRVARRDDLMAHLKERGIGTLIHYPVPIHLQQAYADLGHKPGDFPRAEEACNEVLSLPMYPEMTLSDIGQVAEAIADFRP
jgi:dTDP-4-amino-4,6-dideoxygalactose transaminase